jgi:hypothetical protein
MKLVLACLVSLVSVATATATDSLPLDGSWRFRLDDRKEGVAQRWFTAKLPDEVRLPGRTDTNGKGTWNQNRNQTNMLSRVVIHHGSARGGRSYGVGLEAGDSVPSVVYQNL